MGILIVVGLIACLCIFLLLALPMTKRRKVRSAFRFVLNEQRPAFGARQHVPLNDLRRYVTLKFLREPIESDELLAAADHASVCEVCGGIERAVIRLCEGSPRRPVRA